MDEINPTILKTTIEAIPTLTKENFSSWRTCITALFKLGRVKDQMINGEPALDDTDNTILCAIIIAKLLTTTHNNVVNSTNKDNAIELWKAISKRFILTKPSNRARVYNQFTSIEFDVSNIKKFITEVRASLVKMEDVGIKIEDDIVTYDLLKRLPASLDNIKQAITHSKDAEDIKPSALLDHLEIHMNELKVTASLKKLEVTTMYTEKNKKCSPDKHNPLANHPAERCWLDSNVCSLSTFSSLRPSSFILNSGSTSHMITVNLLSLHQLLLEKFNIQFDINKFSVNKDCKTILEGHYHNNLPLIEFEGIRHQNHLSQAEQLHKSLGHVSYSRIRNKLGITIKPPASKPFEELHLDLIGPIGPMSHKNHKYILTIVNGNTRFCSAIPIKAKSDVYSVLTFLVDTEAKRLGYYPSVIHSDRGTEFVNAGLEEYCKKNLIRQRYSNAYTPQQNGLAERFNRTILESLRTILDDSGLRRTLWNEVLSTCMLTLNQIPTHKRKKSPYELFKGQVIPLEFFRPIGNPVVVYSHQKKAKLDPWGEMGRLIGFDAELKCYRILLNNGHILDTKNVDFLDFKPSKPPEVEHDELFIEERTENLVPSAVSPPESENINVKEEEVEDEEGLEEETREFVTAGEEESEGDEMDVAEALAPANHHPVGRILRDRTLQVKPVKYSHLTALASSDPKTFKKAVLGDKADSWMKAINAELDTIEDHKVWVDQWDTPAKYLNGTWVFKTKPATNSSPEKQKARFCIQGFLQTYGEDYFETFAPTGKFPSLLTLLVLAIDLKLKIRQFDVKSAFLFAPLEEEIFIRTPEGSKRKAPFLKVVKSLYGLKQAPKNWYETLTGWFQEIDYLLSTSDACLFIHHEKNSFIFFHVDDLIVVGRPDEFEELFLRRFPNSSAHDPDTLLGMNVSVHNESITLAQPALIQKGLEVLDMTDCKPVKTPLTPGIQLKPASDAEHECFLALKINYRSYTGMLNYLACRTRPDLASAVSILSRFNQRPGIQHWKEVLHVWKYLQGTKDMGLLLEPRSSDLEERIQFYTDATWAEDQETRLSQSGSIAFWKACPISWNSKKQKNITMSSTESKLNALSDGEQENQWLAFLIEELWHLKLPATIFNVDNRGLVEKLKKFGSNSKTKHLDIKIKALRDKFSKQEIDVRLIPSEQMLADSLTKAAPRQSVRKLQDKCLIVF
ncbi:hypothetical protein VP01_2694g2 [Puccinia sorghi]|uniref:Integrase catalytic domain-containing protein n=1 Tax=Puccinia sorghi TaxID=27349 RepID=A0A0L6V5K8_9BASI|nr:hypothetical protein VP01_2694g2 [Puccinia sorghi]